MVTLEDRPSSSSGPGTGTKRTDFDKRKSRDDLYLMTMTTEKQNFRSFHVPSRNRFFSVDSGGGPDQPSQSLQQHLAVPPRQHQPMQSSAASSTADNGGTGVIAIGMALGSPAHPPAGAWTSWQPQPQVQLQQQQAQAKPQFQSLSPSPGSVTSPPSQVSTPELGAPDEPTAKPRRKWSLFTRSKSKKGKNPLSSDPKSPPPQLPAQQQRQAQAQRQQQNDANQLSRRESPVESVRSQDKPQGPVGNRVDQSTTSKPKYKPIVIPYEPPLLSARDPKSASPSPRSQQPSHKLLQQDLRNPNSRLPPFVGQPKMALRGPMLDVEIPDITMERYSIMFGQVLQKPTSRNEHTQITPPVITRPAPPPPSLKPAPDLKASASSSSLLARRQATLGRLKTIGDEGLEPLQPPRTRRASSSQAKPSPALHLFPPTTMDKTNSGTPRSPRARSSTSPAGLPMPTRPAPEPPIQRLESSRAQTFPRIGSNAGLNDNTMSSTPLAGRPRLTSKFQRQQSQPEVRSVTSFVDSPTSLDESSPRPIRKESAPDVITPPTSTTSSRANTPKKDSLSSIASEHITVSKQPEHVVEDKTLRDAVEASITRQISVSREQREMLKPFRAQSRRKVKPLGATNIAIGENERIAETKKATPTLVHPDADAMSPKSVGNLFRRSEQVVFDDA